MILITTVPDSHHPDDFLVKAIVKVYYSRSTWKGNARVVSICRCGGVGILLLDLSVPAEYFYKTSWLLISEYKSCGDNLMIVTFIDLLQKSLNNLYLRRNLQLSIFFFFFFFFPLTTTLFEVILNEKRVFFHSSLSFKVSSMEQFSEIPYGSEYVRTLAKSISECCKNLQHAAALCHLLNLHLGETENESAKKQYGRLCGVIPPPPFTA